MKVQDLQTPALIVERAALEHNLATMAAALPGPRLRPHVKAHKTSALAARQRAAGHHGFTCATPREVLGLAAAGLGEDLLLANETVDAERLRRMATCDARVTLAVDSDATVGAAAVAGISEVLIDVNIGLPRCGCAPEDAGRLAAHARQRGLSVRGVMGYEGHLMGLQQREERALGITDSMQKLAAAHAAVGGDIVSAGGTGTYDLQSVATEVQAGSYVLMDTAYAKQGLPFQHALFVLATVISRSQPWAVCDAGLKAFGMDHGNPSMQSGNLLFCSDEHSTFVPDGPVTVGQKVRMLPAHVDPTVAYHDTMFLVDGDHVLETWSVDLRGW